MRQLLMRRPHLRDLPAPPPLPAGYSLRLYSGTDDLASLAATLEAAYGEHWDEALVRTRLTGAPDVHAVYLATWRGRAVATASSRRLPERFPAAGYVHWVATDPTHARRGLAAALLDRVLGDFRARGDRAAVLETDDARTPALRLYLRYGFVPVDSVMGEDHRERWSAVFQALFGG